MFNHDSVLKILERCVPIGISMLSSAKTIILKNQEDAV